ncbi:hypothetical protein [Geothrix edaphica]|uniref:Esterase-like activity of phytase family protein n=1 Tax=Geothrix edaphica TaxID=2927976 RepID=A0ABQ5PZ11_9BACT|nr:hypothetical protein [Geothrix edaphica]GLH67325.1 hypothetical protein GETHED_16890 [Geothrix edaphica]
MRSFPIYASILGALLCLTSATGSAQAWDAASRAASWAKQDKDDSFTFYDAAGRVLHTWARDGGLMGTLPLGKLDGEPDRWVIDPRNTAWVAHGTTLTHIDRTGRTMGSVRLPAEVGDISWDAVGMILSYRAAEPYIEKREFRNAEVIWSFGAKPAKKEGSLPQNRRPITLDDSGNILMADGNTLNLSILDANTGKKIGETSLRHQAAPAPALEGSPLDRGPLAVWVGKGVVFAALKATQVPATQRGTFQGLVLARLDLPHTSVEFLPTGLDDSHILVGILDSDAVFVNPKGGLMLVKVK